MKAALSSKSVHDVIRQETEHAIKGFLKETRKKDDLLNMKKPTPVGIQSWVAADAVDQKKAYKYVATEEKPSYLNILKSARTVGDEALVFHGDTLTFLEDDQIAHNQAAALKEAEVLQAKQNAAGAAASRAGGSAVVAPVTPAMAAQALAAKAAGKAVAAPAKAAGGAVPVPGAVAVPATTPAAIPAVVAAIKK